MGTDVRKMKTSYAKINESNLRDMANAVNFIHVEGESHEGYNVHNMCAPQSAKLLNKNVAFDNVQYET